MLLVLQTEIASGWVGTTMAISLIIIALSFITIAAAMAIAFRRAAQEMHDLRAGLDSLRGDLGPALKAIQQFSGESERLVAMVSEETEEVVAASQALRAGLREKLTNLEAVYDVLAEEVEETAIDAAVTLRNFRTGASWFGMIRRLLRLGRGR
jgi:uncharacterized protein YoxC